jgi:lipid-binding SYLF domain-containing protein
VKTACINLLRRCALPLALLAISLPPSLGHAQSSEKRENPRSPEANAAKNVQDTVAVVKRMEADSTMQQVLTEAKGVFIVPTYGRAAFGIGGQGGSGVLLVKQASGSWSDPAFFNIGGISIGAQVGAEGGPIAFALMNDKAVQRFSNQNNFSLSADAGLTVINWAKLAQGSTGGGDAVAWSGTKGLFGNVATLGANDIRFNQRLTHAYYGKPTTTEEVISGKVKNPDSDALKQALAAISSGSAAGKSEGGTQSGGGMPSAPVEERSKHR